MQLDSNKTSKKGSSSYGKSPWRIIIAIIIIVLIFTILRRQGADEVDSVYVDEIIERPENVEDEPVHEVPEELREPE